MNVVIVRNVRTNDLYSSNGNDNVFTNLRTGASGNVTDEAAQKTFRINLEMTGIINEYPIVAELIKRLNLKMDGLVSSNT